LIGDMTIENETLRAIDNKAISIGLRFCGDANGVM